MTLVLLLGTLFALSQPLEVMAQNSLESGFERDVNRYRWTVGILTQANTDAWKVSLSNQFRSDAFILFDDQLSFRDENRTRFRAGRSMGSGVSEFVLYGSADWFSLSRVFRQDTWAGFRFSPLRSLWIEPAVGLATDARPGFGMDPANIPLRTDVGPAIGLRYGLPITDFNGYLVEASGTAQIQRTNPRIGSVIRSEIRSSRTFEKTTVRTRFSGASVRRDAYQAASFLNRDDSAGRRAETVESTRSDTVTVGIDLESQVASPLWLTGSLDVSANRRKVETLRAPESALFFDSAFNRRNVEISIAARYDQASTRARVAFIAGVEVERRKLDNADDLPAAQASQKLDILRQADKERGYFALQSNLNFSPARWWDIQFDGSANILKHDTPDVNLDDRDELLYNGLVGSRFRIREGLDITVQVLGSWFHTVYLKSLRSAENSVQKSIRYRPSVQWRPSPRTRFRLSSEVRATYTVDDFLLPGRRPTDQAAREMRFDLEADHDFGDGVRALVTASLSDLQLGRFLEDVFAEIPFDTLKTYSVWARVQTGSKVQAELGMRFFIRTDYDRVATVRYQAESSGEEFSISRMGRKKIGQIGPTTAIVWPMRRNAFLRIDGWATIQRVSHKLYGDLPEGFETDIRSASKRGKRTVIPNLALTMRWAF